MPIVGQGDYLAVIWAIAKLRLPPPNASGKHQYVLYELREGIGYALGFAPIRTILILLAMVSLIGMPYTILMPIFAKGILQGGANTYGFLLAASGFGALAMIASSNTVVQTIVENQKRGRVMSLFTMAFMGMTPIASLAAGALADTVGARRL